VLLVAGAAILGGCHLIEEKLTPTEPTPSATPAPLSIPVVLGTPPSPAPTTSPGPNPTPAPTAAPAPPPTGGSCGLPASNNPDAPCTAQSQSFLAQVDKAITQVTQQQPGLFDFNSNRCENCYYIKDQDRFAAAVVANLGAMGLCAYYDGEELGVKNTNSWNDQYDIIISSGHIRRGPGSYRTTCTPAWF
jgi:hypothetical protein